MANLTNEEMKAIAQIIDEALKDLTSKKLSDEELLKHNVEEFKKQVRMYGDWGVIFYTNLYTIFHQFKTAKDLADAKKCFYETVTKMGPSVWEPSLGYFVFPDVDQCDAHVKTYESHKTTQYHKNIAKFAIENGLVPFVACFNYDMLKICAKRNRRIKQFCNLVETKIIKS
jgi:hypothetical protein